MTDDAQTPLIQDPDTWSVVQETYPTIALKAQRVIEVCRDLGLSVAVAESLTGGNLQAALSSVSGASECFRGGVTAYNIDQKVNILAVDRKVAAACNCVSKDVAAQMTWGAHSLFNADVVVATTGYAEPYSGDGDIAEPFAHIVVFYPRDSMASGHTKAHVKAEKLMGSRVEVQRRVTDTALVMLILALEESCRN